jgi:hypothetical protein
VEFVFVFELKVDGEMEASEFDWEKQIRIQIITGYIRHPNRDFSSCGHALGAQAVTRQPVTR